MNNRIASHFDAVYGKVNAYDKYFSKFTEEEVQEAVEHGSAMAHAIISEPATEALHLQCGSTEDCLERHGESPLMAFALCLDINKVDSKLPESLTVYRIVFPVNEDGEPWSEVELGYFATSIAAKLCEQEMVPIACGFSSPGRPDDSWAARVHVSSIAGYDRAAYLTKKDGGIDCNVDDDWTSQKKNISMGGKELGHHVLHIAEQYAAGDSKMRQTLENCPDITEIAELYRS